MGSGQWERGRVHRVSSARLVLVRDGAAVWTGELDRWELVDRAWYGHVRWEAYLQRRSGLVPADRLRPFARLAVDVCNPFGQWEPGVLLAWRRRPGARYWEGQVRSGGELSEALVDWYPAAKVRPRLGGGVGPYDDAF